MVFAHPPASLAPVPVSYTHLDVYKRQEQLLAGGSLSVQIDCTMSMLGNFALIAVRGDLSGVGCTLEVFDVIAYCEDQLVCLLYTSTFPIRQCR